MTLQELGSTAAVHDFITQHKNALVTFSAHWCGPCRASKPALTDMATQYARDVTKDVKFGIVYENDLGDDIHQFRIRAFPTYVLFVGGREADRVEGVNLDGIRQMIDKFGSHGVDMSSKGETLGGSGPAKSVSPEEARALRLAKLGVAAAPAAPAQPPAQVPVTTATPPPQQEVEVVAMDEDKPAVAKKNDADDGDVAMKDADEEEDKPAAPVDPCANLDKEALATLTDAMGFPLLRAQKGLLYGNGGTLEGAVDWLTEHQDDVDIDQPIPAVVALSYRCNDCGKILSNMANLELHANKTGHSDFEESTERVKPLSAEDKIKKIAEIKELLKAKRAERENAEKEDEKEREKQRRFMGKEMAKTREQVEAEQRKRDAMLRRREKEDARRERERIRAELAKDKAERQANKGKLSSKLGVDGYNPDAIQYDFNPDGADAHHHHEKKLHVNSAKIDDYIKKVSAYRAAGDGGNCLKVLIAYVSNVVKNPDEPKYKSINMENKAYKAKVKPFVGAKALLEAVGFLPNDAGDALVLRDDADVKLMSDTVAKLEAAHAAYLKQG